MTQSTVFRPYEPDQQFLLPPAMSDWLPEGHLAYFIQDIAASLDLSAIYASYDGSRGGYPPYHPQMMTALLLYAYCVGLPSSRRIEKATHEQIPFRVIAADQHPDHDTICEFRRRHLAALSGLFVQALRLCQKAGLVSLGHVALDGTKVRANASKHKAMSYDRMEKSAVELEAEVKRLMEEAETTDQAEDAQLGKGNRGDSLPEELKFKSTRLKKIQEAKAALEAEAVKQAEVATAEFEEKKKAHEESGGRGRAPQPPPENPKPDPKAQRNFTDPESRIMKDGATKSFEQSYNAQAAVDDKAQVIVATNLTQEANDKRQVKPLIENLKSNLEGATPEAVTADNGYYSEENADYLQSEGIEGYVATGRLKHGEKAPAPDEPLADDATAKERMAYKLRTMKGRATYSKRKQTVEPVFGQIKEARGIRRFLLRGIDKVSAEWDLICLTHNLLKVFRSGWRPSGAC